jgi:methylmalonyl-CoA/ethylmalonyl-CoA epimerase
MSSRNLEVIAFSHVGFAVRSVEDFRSSWGAALGISEWLVHREEIPDGLRLHGELIGPVAANVAYGRCGGVVLELIETYEGRTHHLEHIESRGAGLHHLGFWVRDLAAELEKIDQLGLEVVMAPPSSPVPLTGRPVSAVLPDASRVPEALESASGMVPLVSFLDTILGNAHFALELMDARFAPYYQGLNTFEPTATG